MEDESSYESGGLLKFIRPDRWMEICGEMKSSKYENKMFKDIPINEIVMLGSHDSGTYQKNDYRIAENCNDEVKKVFQCIDCSMLCCFPISIPLKAFSLRRMVDWSLCQELPLFQQLNNGVRYLDLRIGFHNDEPWVCHSVYCVKLEKALTEISEFLEKNKKEVVIVDVQHTYSVEKLPVLFEKIVIEVIGKYLCNISFSSSKHENNEKKEIPLYSLQTAWSSGRRIIFLLQQHLFTLIPEASKKGILNRENYIRSVWPRKGTIEGMVEFVDEELKSKYHKFVKTLRKFHVTQCIVTPTISTILEYSSMLEVGKSTVHEFLDKFQKLEEWRDRSDYSILIFDNCCTSKEFIQFLIHRNVVENGREKISKRFSSDSDISNESENEGEDESDEKEKIEIVI